MNMHGTGCLLQHPLSSASSCIAIVSVNMKCVDQLLVLVRVADDTPRPAGGLVCCLVQGLVRSFITLFTDFGLVTNTLTRFCFRIGTRAPFSFAVVFRIGPVLMSSGRTTGFGLFSAPGGRPGPRFTGGGTCTGFMTGASKKISPKTSS